MNGEDDLVPTQTEGYHVGEKKTIEDYEKLDANDESLRKWKESLGLNKASAVSPSDDPRKVVVTALVLEVEGRDDVVMDVSTPGNLSLAYLTVPSQLFNLFFLNFFFKNIKIEAISTLKKTPLVIKEGIAYRLKIRFRYSFSLPLFSLQHFPFITKAKISLRIQHDVISGLKYLHAVKRAGITVDKTEEMLGSYGPSDEEYEKKFLPEEAPSGMLARGKYTVKSKFIDDDNISHLEWEWIMEIKKDWK
ncbi:Rho GDP-dissociation inhibitor [Smittium mucronatum]|uniref:Rho GDP-dissociation inhibitor n=1 Tax=Smittium mucronatum TaxID=133383 RepID=A0A1R0H0L2_9FUNG|nr:Rho GDP-dissociation inhibitor [Smittium mucronatum]